MDIIFCHIFAFNRIKLFSNFDAICQKNPTEFAYKLLLNVDEMLTYYYHYLSAKCASNSGSNTSVFGLILTGALTVLLMFELILFILVLLVFFANLFM